jgi:hypothetical protein
MVRILFECQVERCRKEAGLVGLRLRVEWKGLRMRTKHRALFEECVGASEECSEAMVRTCHVMSPALTPASKALMLAADGQTRSEGWPGPAMLMGEVAQWRYMEVIQEWHIHLYLQCGCF